MKRIEGELFKLEAAEENIVKMSDSKINAKYKRGDIRIVTEQARYPIKSIRGMLASGDYKLNPEYQRRKRWSNTRKSRLIESFIMNVPLPPVFLYEYEYSKYEVMDGLQRLTSINDFYMPGLMDVNEAANLIFKYMNSNKFEFYCYYSNDINDNATNWYKKNSD